MKNIKNFIISFALCMGALLARDLCAAEVPTSSVSEADIAEQVQQLEQVIGDVDKVKAEAQIKINQARQELEKGEFTKEKLVKAMKIIGTENYKIKKAEEQTANMIMRTLNNLSISGAYSWLRGYSQETKEIAQATIEEINKKLKENIDEQTKNELIEELRRQKLITGEEMSVNEARLWTALKVAGAIAATGILLKVGSQYLSETNVPAELSSSKITEVPKFPQVTPIIPVTPPLIAEIPSVTTEIPSVTTVPSPLRSPQQERIARQKEDVAKRTGTGAWGWWQSRQAPKTQQAVTPSAETIVPSSRSASQQERIARQKEDVAKRTGTGARGWWQSRQASKTQQAVTPPAETTVPSSRGASQQERIAKQREQEAIAKAQEASLEYETPQVVEPSETKSLWGRAREAIGEWGKKAQEFFSPTEGKPELETRETGTTQQQSIKNIEELSDQKRRVDAQIANQERLKMGKEELIADKEKSINELLLTQPRSRSAKMKIATYKQQANAAQQQANVYANQIDALNQQLDKINEQLEAQMPTDFPWIRD